jgi:hypothetical protein
MVCNQELNAVQTYGKVMLELTCTSRGVHDSVGVMTLTHPSLSGELTFQYTSAGLAKAQLDYLAAKPETPSSVIGSIAKDAEELMVLAKGLREEVSGIKKPLKGGT